MTAMTNLPHPAPTSDSSMARPGTPLASIRTVGLICGPGTKPDHLADIGSLGEGWRAALEAWRLSEALYCFFLADDRHDGTHRFAHPVIFCSSDRSQLEHDVWSVTAMRTNRAWVIDSLEPTLDSFVERLKSSESLAAGHA
jgi:hypothetical protein